MSELNAVVQVIVTSPGVAFSRMSAGSAWFPASDTISGGLPEGTMLTNAHVVRNASSVFIRLPCSTSEYIKVFVHSISTDLDLAVIRLDCDELARVKQLLKEKYNVTEIPTLQLIDSDTVHPHRYDNLKAPRVIARGYPLGNEYQSWTDGIISGLKTAMENIYITSTATINGGNSGGPLVDTSNRVIGINSMKIRGAEEINMVIPSNRILKVLSPMLDNFDNEHAVDKIDQRQRHEALARTIFAKILTGNPPSRSQVETTAKLLHNTVNIDVCRAISFWNKMNAGGFKRVNGIISPVTLSDFFMQHVHGKAEGHAIFETVMTHLDAEQMDEIANMRTNGFSKYKCEQCSSGVSCNRNETMSKTPPRVLYMPRLGFSYANSTPATLKKYDTEKTGIVLYGIVSDSLFDKHGAKNGDFLHRVEYVVDGTLKKFEIDNYGQAWIDSLSASLTIRDIIHRSKFGNTVHLHVRRENGDHEVLALEYDCLKYADMPNVRFLDSMRDIPMRSEIINFRGLHLKPLRLAEALEFKKSKYLQQKHENTFKVIVVDIDAHSDAFMSRNFRPGYVLDKINDNKLDVQNWEQFKEKMESFDNDTPVKFEVEENRVLII